MTEIIPAVLPKSFKELKQTLGRLNGLVSLVQIDIADGNFVPNATWPYTKEHDEHFEALANQEEGLPFWEELDFEIDLMVAFPEEVLEQWLNVGASRVVLHYESNENIADAIALAKDLELEVGLAIGHETELPKISKLIADVDFIQCMGIRKAGYQGQEFEQETISRVAVLRKEYPELSISVDGGVTLENALDLIAAGATRLVVGSAILTSSDISATIEEFQDL